MIGHCVRIIMELLPLTNFWCGTAKGGCNPGHLRFRKESQRTQERSKQVDKAARRSLGTLSSWQQKSIKDLVHPHPVHLLTCPIGIQHHLQTSVLVTSVPSSFVTLQITTLAFALIFTLIFSSHNILFYLHSLLSTIYHTLYNQYQWHPLRPDRKSVV